MADAQTHPVLLVPPAITEAIRYDVFISYRHREPDTTWANWLLRELEGYKPPGSVRASLRGLSFLATRLGRRRPTLDERSLGSAARARSIALDLRASSSLLPRSRAKSSRASCDKGCSPNMLSSFRQPTERSVELAPSLAQA